MVIECPECKARYRTNSSRSDQTVVRLKCPKCAATFEVDKSAETPEKQVAQVAGPAVLIVDDAAFFREVLSEVLVPLKLQLTAVASAREAIEALQKQAFRLVLLDINLPDLNGVELIRKIRRHESLKEMKILVISGAYRNNSYQQDSLRAGADGFLSKSFTPDELLLKVRALLDL